MWPDEELGVDTDDVAGCSMTDEPDSELLLKLEVSDDASRMSEGIAIDASVAKDPDSQCPAGVELNGASMSSESETSLVCGKSDRWIFSYLGKFDDSTVSVRVIRPDEISSKESQGWLADVRAALAKSGS